VAFLADRAEELEAGADAIFSDGTTRQHRFTTEGWRAEAAYLGSALNTARSRRATDRERQVVDIVLRRLAQPWAHHSDFQPGWRTQ
jgi:hypothetical protein